MSELPALSQDARRKLALRLEELKEDHRLTGQHLTWHANEWDRQRGIAAQGGSSEPDRASTFNRATIQSVSLAKLRLKNLAVFYFQRWSASCKPNEVFKRWLHELREQVAAEVVAIWQEGSNEVLEWFACTCRPAIDGALDEIVVEQAARARKLELNRLEHPDRFPHYLARMRARSSEGHGARESTSTKIANTTNSPGSRLASRSVGSRAAVQEMNRYISAKNQSLTEFATLAGTSDRTLRKFRKTLQIRRSTFGGIARAMGMTREELLRGGQA